MQSGVDFISHDNISEDCLNSGGLHLNRKGVFNSPAILGSTLMYVVFNILLMRKVTQTVRISGHFAFHEVMSEMRGFKMGCLNINSLLKL